MMRDRKRRLTEAEFLREVETLLKRRLELEAAALKISRSNIRPTSEREGNYVRQQQPGK